jgi:hypothetical protein
MEFNYPTAQRKPADPFQHTDPHAFKPEKELQRPRAGAQSTQGRLLRWPPITAARWAGIYRPKQAPVWVAQGAPAAARFAAGCAERRRR